VRLGLCFHPAASAGSSLSFSFLASDPAVPPPPTFLLIPVCCQRATGSAAKSPLPGLALGTPGSPSSPPVTLSSRGFPLANAVLRSLSASGRPQRPCSVLVFFHFTGCRLFLRAISSFVSVFLFCADYLSMVLHQDDVMFWLREL